TGTVFTYANPIGVDDFIIVEFDAHDTSAFSADAAYAIGFSIGGGAFALGGSFDGTGEPHWFTQSGSARVAIRAKYTGPVKSSALPIAAGGLRICLFAIQKTGGASSVQLAQPHQLVVTHYRARESRVLPRNLIAAAWDVFNAEWWATASSTNDTVAVSKDFGHTWTDVTPGASGIALQSVAVDLAGNVVCVGHSSDLYEFNASTSTWTHRAGAFASPTLSEVAFEPVNGLWIAYENTGFAFMKVHTSTDRATWTDQGSHLPAALGGDGVHFYQPRLGVGGGRIVVAILQNAGTVAVSGCAGTDPTTWTTAATITPTITSPTAVSDPVYVASVATWFLAIVGSGASHAATEVWKSTDGGATWTKAATLGGTTRAIALVQLAVLDRLVTGLDSAGVVVYSLDDGATWKISGTIGTPGATARSLWAGDGGMIALDTGGAFDGVCSTARDGAPNAAAVAA
ncbi:MAG TPA: sialidase family protein, partial [Polyangiaceae bacterium]